MSSTLRESTLELLYNILTKPYLYGDKDMVDLIYRNRYGTVQIQWLLTQAKELQKYPRDYVIHCIVQDPENRFYLSRDESRVGIVRHIFSRERDPYGSLIDVQQSAEHKVVAPIIYRDGKFYADEDYDQQPNPICPNILPPEYDPLDIVPLGMDPKIYIPTGCYNCGCAEHEVSNCPDPKDQDAIVDRRRRSRRRRRRRNKHRSAVRNMEGFMVTPGILSDRLREALDIGPDEDPPYYSMMRVYGYPPGYMVTPVKEVPLKIFDVPEDTDEEPPEPELEEKQLYEYPNLNLHLDDFTSPLPQSTDTPSIHNDPSLPAYPMDYIYPGYYIDPTPSDPNAVAWNSYYEYPTYPSTYNDPTSHTSPLDPIPTEANSLPTAVYLSDDDMDISSGDDDLAI
ncbi:hypothetical protein BDB01DRAFT_815786 [Pilobolus umbonatus]|nr:hypothetical protein BDB01DRAFT_815786 [Pilobolus umbonatus]